MKARQIVSMLLAALMLLCLFAGCNDTGENDDGGELVGAVGVKMTSYNGYLGCGYNVINSNYYNPKEIKPCALDVDKLAADGLIYETADSAKWSTDITIVGETLESYSQNLGISAGANVKGLFSASVSADFKINSKVDESKSFVKISSLKVARKQEIDRTKITAKKLRENYVSEYYMNKYLLNPTVTPEELFQECGTHILLVVYLGGRFDMSFTYNNTKKEDASALSVKATAAYACVSGTAGTDMDSSTSSFLSNSTFTCKAYGGDIATDISTFETAKKNYANWLKGIKDKDNQTFVEAGELSSEDDLLPIWMLIDETKYKERYNEVKNAYKNLLETSGKNITNLQEIPALVDGGIYTIIPALTNDKCVHPKEDKVMEAVHLWIKYNDTFYAQQWVAEADSEHPGYYYLRNREFNKYISVSYWGKSENTPITLWDKQSDGELFKITQEDNGYYRIIPYIDPVKVLGIVKNNIDNGSQLTTQYKQPGNLSQMWKIVQVPNP